MGKIEALFSPIHGHASFKDQAVELLTDRIMSGKIKPGERLNESSLSQQLRISRAPIREALQQLQEQGLVQNIPEALRLARSYITPQKVKKLGQLMKQIEDAKPAPTNESVRLDMEFHRTIWSSTGNEYLEKTLTSLTAPLFAHRMVTYVQTETQSFVLDTHRPMFDFVAGKSDQTAEAVMMAHLSRRWPEPARYSSLCGQRTGRPLPLQRRDDVRNNVPIQDLVHLDRFLAGQAGDVRSSSGAVGNLQVAQSFVKSTPDTSIFEQLPGLNDVPLELSGVIDAPLSKRMVESDGEMWAKIMQPADESRAPHLQSDDD
jgi:DNA-binding GntR family transcriptional regulator